MKASASAKVNFTLEVLGKRPDGYHALRSLVVPISLSDTLDIELTEDGDVRSDSGYPDDLCVRSATVLRSLFPVPRSLGACIRVTKRIPVGGGLGGGSADAAAVLLALNELWHLGKTPEELAAAGAAVGSDVPALVLAQRYRCPVLMEGRGETVSALRSLLPASRPVNLVLSAPGVFSSTSEVYAACSPRASDAPSATAAMIAALQTDSMNAIAAALQNDLREPAVRLHPEIGEAMSAQRAAGVAGVTMSGSGSCVFGFVPDGPTAVRLAADFTSRGLASWPLRTLDP